MIATTSVVTRLLVSTRQGAGAWGSSTSGPEPGRGPGRRRPHRAGPGAPVGWRRTAPGGAAPSASRETPLSDQPPADPSPAPDGGADLTPGPHGFPRVPWGLPQVGLAILLMVPALVAALLALMGVELALRAAGALGPGGHARSPIVVGGLNFLFDLLIYAAALLVVAYLAVWRPRGRWAALGVRRTAVAPLLLMPPVALAIQFAGGLISQVVAGALHAGRNPQTCAVRVGFGNEVLLAVVAVGVVAPVAEELIFRGFIYGALRQRMPWGAAALLSAVIFAAFHAPSVQGYVLVLAPTLLLAGVVLAAVYERTRSLIPGMVLHASFNLIAVAAIFATGMGGHCR